MERPYTIVSCAVSLDGCIDDAGAGRLRLSSDEDFDEVHALRAECDAILVGAGTVRADDPGLLVKPEARRDARKAEGRTGDIVKAVISGSGRLEPGARVFTTGDAEKVVYVGSPAYAESEGRFRAAPGVAVVDAGAPVDVRTVLADLAGRGVRRLLVEGGTHVHTLFLTAGLADELRLALAPFFVGDADAPKFTGPGVFADGPHHPMRLVDVRDVGGTAVLRYRRADAERPAPPAGDAGEPR